MSGIKIAEVYADMNLNMQQQILGTMNGQMNKLGKLSREYLSNSMLISQPLGVGSSILSFGKLLMGFIGKAAVSDSFALITGAAKTINTRIGKSLDFIDSIKDSVISLDLPFRQVQQLDMAATMGSINETGGLQQQIQQFEKQLTAYKNGEATEITALIGEILGNYIGKENNIQLFARMILSNKYRGRSTTLNSEELLFGDMSNNVESNQLGSTNDMLALPNRDNMVKHVLNADSNMQVRTASEGLETEQSTREITYLMEGILSYLSNELSQFIKTMESPIFWIDIIKKALKSMLPRFGNK